MSETGDLYIDFLDLPPGPRPPNHYAILLLPDFEPDPKVIHEAVLNQNAKLRRWALHPDKDTRDRVQEMLNELGRADFILGDPRTKAEYDRALARDLGVEPPEVAPPVAPPAPRPPMPQAARVPAATCPSCGGRLKPGDAFCPACGHRLSQEVRPAKAPAATEAPRPIRKPVPRARPKTAAPIVAMALAAVAVGFLVYRATRREAPVDPRLTEARAAWETAVAKADAALLEKHVPQAWQAAKQSAEEAETRANAGSTDEALRLFHDATGALARAAAMALATETRAIETRFHAELVKGDSTQAAAALARLEQLIPGDPKLTLLRRELTDIQDKARYDQAIAAAEAALAKEDYEAAAKEVQTARRALPNATIPKKILDAIQPSLTVMAELAGKEYQGALVSLNGMAQSQSTPAVLRLEEGKTYVVEVTIPNPGDKKFAKAAKNYTADWHGPRTFRAPIIEEAQAKFAQALAAAEAALAKEDYEAAAKEVQAARRARPNAPIPKKILDAIQPRLTVIAELAGKELKDASVFLDGIRRAESTPATLRLDEGKTYEVEVSIPDQDGKKFAKATKTYTTDWHGPKTFSAAISEEGQAKFDQAIAAARGALAKKDYEAAAKEVQAVRRALPKTPVPKDILDGIQPTLTVIAEFGGAEFKGALLSINGTRQVESTPTTLHLEEGKTYVVQVTVPNPGGKRTAIASKTFTAIWHGPQTFRAATSEEAYGQAWVYTDWPFDAAEAVRRQQETARALGVQVEEEVTVGKMDPAEVTRRKQEGARFARALLGPGAEVGVDAHFVKGVKLTLVLIPAGEFMMGVPRNQQGPFEKGDLHRVTIDKPFWMGKYEVTLEQCETVMRGYPSRLKEANAPLEGVSWDGIQGFLKKLNKGQGGRFALPTEAQWEYACRAGSAGRFCFGDDEAQLGDYAWYANNSLDKSPSYSRYNTHAVGQKRPNAWGLHDMHGNVEEWCSSPYQEKYDGRELKGAEAAGAFRAIRGGSAGTSAEVCRSASRLARGSKSLDGGPQGFRVVRSAAISQAAIGRAEGTTIGLPPQPEGSGNNCPGWPFDEKEAKRRQKAAADALGAKVEQDIDLGGRVKMTLVLIPAGEFLMGSPPTTNPLKLAAAFGNRFYGTPNYYEPEFPQHRVKISMPFWMGKHEVTQEQWMAVFPTNPSAYKGKPNNPVEQVDWNQAHEFAMALSEKLGKTFRLPTEAEWEYACRAGTATEFYFGNDTSKLADFVWDSDSTQPVGMKKPNAWDLYDMSGNVWEWCEDWYGPYESGSQTDPRGPATGERRVLRGGFRGSCPWDLRSAYRQTPATGVPFRTIGFRVVLVPESR